MLSEKKIIARKISVNICLACVLVLGFISVLGTGGGGGGDSGSSTADTTAPTVDSTTPQDGATNVSHSTDWVSITFSEEMDTNHYSISSSDDNWPLSNSTTSNWSSDHKTYEISRDNAGTLLPEDVTISFTLNPTTETNKFQDLAGNNLDTYHFSFTTN